MDPERQGGASTPTAGDTRAEGSSGPATRDEDAFEAVPVVADRYVIIGKIGEGGMSRVYRAWDLRLERHVALKVLKSDIVGHDGGARLVREARSMASLSHPNLLPVYDVAEHEDRIFIVMEFVAGMTLRVWLATERRDWARVVTMFRAAAQGLAAAHVAGFVHRDFKPDNVLVGDDDRVRVMDFGLVRGVADPSRSIEATPRALAATDEITAQGSVLGTVRYMAPEQHRGETLGPAADQYAFCVALWEALVGTGPFHGIGIKELAMAKAEGPPPWPADIRVPRSVTDAVRRGLAPHPSFRWPSMSALLAELSRGTRPWRRGVAIAMLSLGTAAIGLGWPRLTRERALAGCEREAADITGPWSDAIALRDDDTWNRIRPWLDDWSQQWQRAHESVCVRIEVEQTLEADVAALARECLQGRRWAFESMLEALTHADAVALQRGVESAAALPPVAPCLDAAWLAHTPRSPDDTATRAAIDEMRRELETIRSLSAFGRVAEAQARTDALLARAEAVGWAPLTAQVRVRAGRIAEGAGRYADAEQLLVDAYFEAALTGADETALDAATSLVFVVGYGSKRPDDGRLWARQSEVLLARLGEDEGPLRARLISNLASVDRNRGAFAEALAGYERSLAILEPTVGAQHPRIATAYSNIAAVYAELGEVETAKEYWVRSLAIYEAVLGPEHPFVALPLGNLASMLMQRQRFAEALPLVQRELRLTEGSFGGEQPAVAEVLAKLGTVHHGLGDDASAEAAYRRALAIREAVLGPDDPELVISLVGLGEALLGQQKPREAIAPLERSIAISEAHESATPQLDVGRFALARALWETGQEARALELARLAAAGHRGRGSNDRAHEIEAWMAQRDASP